MKYCYFCFELNQQRLFFRKKGKPGENDFEFYGSEDNLVWEKYTLSSPSYNERTGTYSYMCTSSTGSQNRITIQDGVRFTLTYLNAAIELTNIGVEVVPPALREPTARYPKSYLDFVVTHDYLRVAKDLLSDYIKGNRYDSPFLSASSLFFCGHWNRHHLKEVKLIVEEITKGEINTLGSLVSRLNGIDAPNPEGSFARRKDFIKILFHWKQSEPSHVAPGTKCF